MLLSRADSSTPASTRPHALPHPPLAAPDLQSLQKSSTAHLRTLSKLAETASAAEVFSIESPAPDVVGLHGRRRLQRSGTTRNDRSTVALGHSTNGYGDWSGTKWMDKQRQFLQAYEYLCHIGEAKEWLEDILNKPIPPIVQLEEALRDGVTLAEIVQALNPDKPIRIFRHPRLQFRHSDNIAIFFNYLRNVELPDTFSFELIDLYEKKNIPKVIYCIHALSWLLFRKGILDFRIGNLVGQLEFEKHELEAMQKDLDKAGVSMPSFGNVGADFGVEPTPEPVESEDDRIARELAEKEGTIVDLQAQIRGALQRMRLGETMNYLWDSEVMLIDLQARIKGDIIRQVTNYHLGRRRFAINLQSAARGFLVRNRQQNQRSAIKFQSAARGFLVRSRQQDQRSAIKFQSAARGFLVRSKQQDQGEFWKSREGEIIELQSLIRAKKARDEVHMTRSLIYGQQPAIRHLQAAIRGGLARKRIDAQSAELHDTKQVASSANALQSAIRGMLVRVGIASTLEKLDSEEASIVAVQTVARAALTRGRIAQQLEELQMLADTWEALQSASKGKLLRDRLAVQRRELKSHSQEIIKIQAAVRAAALRNNIADMLSKLHAEAAAAIVIQSAARGVMLRAKVAANQELLEAQTPAIVALQSCARGFLFRERTDELLHELEQTEPEIIQLQALAKAMLLRSDIGNLLEALEAEEDSIVAAQTAARAFLVRARFAEKQRFFKENMEKVVKIQSFVRGRLQGDAYKSLTTGKNPPVNAVKNFVHLLNDSDFDFNEEVEFERLRKTVVQQVRQNEMCEVWIDQLDIKIALLVKNKITLDEVVRHQKQFGGHAGNLLPNSSMASANQFDLKALNKNSRKKLESYQHFFFVLQTQPQYLARLFKRIREQGTAEKECRRIELLMMGLFGYAQKRREEYYLLKLIARSVKEEVDAAPSIKDYLRGNFFWSKLLANYTRSPRDRKYLRDVLNPLIRENIIEDEELDLESDPLEIYRSAVNNEELRTGQASRRPLDIPRDLAIKDTETRSMFIDHLRDLREISNQFLTALEVFLHRMPYGVRFITQQIFESLCERFPLERQEKLLQTAGNWLWKFYLQPALMVPEQYGVVEKGMTPLQKRNLSEVCKVLSQVAVGTLFGGESIFLQPLNAYIGEAIQRIGAIFSGIINVPVAEITFDIDEFNDLYARQKPTLYIKMSDVFAIHNLVSTEIAHLCPNRDDMLREIVQDLGSVKNNESEMGGVTNEIQMFLTPMLHDLEDPDAEVKTLFMETKRCVLYIIRVQSGPNLMEILVRPISYEDEQKWHALLQEEFAAGSNRGAYSDVNAMVDMTAMSYAQLKRNALENIMRLEQFGRISRHNYYQDILNAIALDIRTKSRRRIQRQRELEGVRLTLANLHEKAVWLDQQRQSYDNYIEQAMMTLQNKKGKKRFLLPFTKQYNHERELARSGRVSKFGSYKYSARTLADKGVLVSWQGYNDRELDKINLTISCDEIGVFAIEGSKGSMMMTGASAIVPMDDLLQAQFNNHQFMNLFENALRLNVNLFLHLVYKKFYRTE